MFDINVETVDGAAAVGSFEGAEHPDAGANVRFITSLVRVYNSKSLLKNAVSMLTPGG